MAVTVGWMRLAPMHGQPLSAAWLCRVWEVALPLTVDAGFAITFSPMAVGPLRHTRTKVGGKSDVAATSYVVKALAALGDTSDGDLVGQGRDWLVRVQREDGGWGVGEGGQRSHIGQTGYAVSALSYSPTSQYSAEALQRAMFFLYKQAEPAGGWSFAPGHVMDVTLSAYVLRGIIDAAVLGGHRPHPEVFLNLVLAAETVPISSRILVGLVRKCR